MANLGVNMNNVFEISPSYPFTCTKRNIGHTNIDSCARQYEDSFVIVKAVQKSQTSPYSVFMKLCKWLQWISPQIHVYFRHIKPPVPF